MGHRTYRVVLQTALFKSFYPARFCVFSCVLRWRGTDFRLEWFENGGVSFHSQSSDKRFFCFCVTLSLNWYAMGIYLLIPVEPFHVFPPNQSLL